MKGWRKEDCGSRVQRESSICRSPHSGEAISIMVGETRSFHCQTLKSTCQVGHLY